MQFYYRCHGQIVLPCWIGRFRRIFLEFSWLIHGTLFAALGSNVLLVLWAVFERHKIRCQYLVILYVSHLVSVLNDIYDVARGWAVLPHLYNAYLPFMFLIAPSLFHYIQCLIEPEKHHRLLVRSYHWLVFFTVLILCIPYFALDHSIKLDRLLAPPNSLEHLGLITLGPFLCLLLFIPYSLVYWVMMLRLIAKHNVNIKFFFSNIENKDLSWLRSILIITMLALVSSAFQLLLPDRITNSDAWSLTYSILGYVWITLFGVLAIKQKPINITITDSEKDNKEPNNKYKNAPLTTLEIDAIKTKLFYSMDTIQLYKKAGLTLGDLAHEIDVSQNKISQVLNNYLGKGFYDYVNSCRVSAAQSIMLTQQKSILDIAYEVGFNSKSTFNSAFKKHTELTPSQFKKKHK